MKTVGYVFRMMATLCALPAWAEGCPPEAWMCASPRMGLASDASSGLQPKEQTLPFGGGRFALEKIDEGAKFGLRPSLKLGDNGRLSLRVGKKTELRMKWAY